MPFQVEVLIRCLYLHSRDDLCEETVKGLYCFIGVTVNEDEPRIREHLQQIFNPHHVGRILRNKPLPLDIQDRFPDQCEVTLFPAGRMVFIAVL